MTRRKQTMGLLALAVGLASAWPAGAVAQAPVPIDLSSRLEEASHYAGWGAAIGGGGGLVYGLVTERGATRSADILGDGLFGMVGGMAIGTIVYIVKISRRTTAARVVPLGGGALPSARFTAPWALSEHQTTIGASPASRLPDATAHATARAVSVRAIFAPLTPVARSTATAGYCSNQGRGALLSSSASKCPARLQSFVWHRSFTGQHPGGAAIQN